MDAATLDAPNTTVAEMVPPTRVEPETIPIGKMLVQLIQSAVPADCDYVKSVIDKTEADLAALKSLHGALSEKFAKLPQPAIVGPKKGGRPKKAKVDEMEAIDAEYDTRTKSVPPRPTKPVSTLPHAPAPNARRVVHETYERRLKISRKLMDGKMRVMEISTQFNIPSGSISAVLSHPFFARDTDGFVYVTPVGRQAAESD